MKQSAKSLKRSAAEANEQLERLHYETTAKRLKPNHDDFESVESSVRKPISGGPLGSSSRFTSKLAVTTNGAEPSDAISARLAPPTPDHLRPTTPTGDRSSKRPKSAARIKHS